jgi:serine/threonine protein kinase/WD40 repeat protein
MSPESGLTADSDDRRVAELLEGLAAKLQAGEPVDLEACARAHPEHAERLRWLLPAAQALADLSRSAPARAPFAGSPPPSSLTGTLGDFRIVREVGRGGMGVVYEAEQISLGRRVALKVLPFAAVLDPTNLRRFQNEARAAAQLHHPNIVPVHGVGSDRGVHYYAMQFIPGHTLADLIAERRRLQADRKPGRQGDRETATAGPATSPGPLNPPVGSGSLSPCLLVPLSALCREVARLGVQAAEALDHAHKQGVVHRDVKPANLMVDAEGRLWVTDFGLAHVHGDGALTRTGDVVGTLRYMSPEQALARRGLVDQRSDVYSLGATLYELLTLRPALDADDRPGLLVQLAHEEPPPARRLEPGIPVDLETVLARAMAKDPAERYATARELADDLQRFLDDRPVLARRPGLGQRLRKWARRHRGLAVSLAVSAALLLAGGMLGLAGYARHQRDLAAEREGTRKKLAGGYYRTLLGEAASLRSERRPGYRAEVWKRLREAARLNVATDGGAAFRAEVLACLGDPIGLDPVAPSRVARSPPPELPAKFREALGKLPPDQRPLMAEPPGRKGLPPAPPPGAENSWRSIWAVTGDGRLLANTGRWGEIIIWRNLASGLQRLFVIDSPLPLAAAYDLQFSPDGDTLVAGCEEGVVSWSVRKMQVVTSFRAGNVCSIAVHPGGRLLAAAGRKVELWSLASHRLVATFPAPGTDCRVEFSADGQYLLALLAGEPVRAWPVKDAPEKRTLDGHGAGVPAVAFSPDGKTLASVSKDRTVRLWDAATGRLRHVGRAHSDPIEAVDFSPDGRWLATGDVRGLVWLWDPASGEARVEIGGRVGPAAPPKSRAPGQIWRLRFSRSGRHLVAAGGLGAAAWDLRLLAGLEPGVKKPGIAKVSCHALDLPGVYDAAVHPNGEDVVLLDGEGRLHRWNLTRGVTARPLDVPARLELRCLHFDDRGERLTFVTRRSTLGVLDWRGGAVRDTGLRAFQLALSPGGRWAATSSPEEGVVIHDLEENREALRLPSQGNDVWGLAWSPDGGRLAVGLSDGGVAIWDLEQVRARLEELGLPAPQPPFRPARPPG